MYFQWQPYVSVSQRKANARKLALKLAKKEGRVVQPVEARGRQIGKTYWGRAWCDNLTSYSDFSNRMPRGRTYLGNGSVADLHIRGGQIDAIVAGSDTYRISIKISELAPKLWKQLQNDCAKSITSLLDLLQGRFDESVMQRLARRDGGLFPQPKEIKMSCSCPDSARLCKHLAAVLYGVGVRLDTSPELLFVLRKVDHMELIAKATATDQLDAAIVGAPTSLSGSDLGELFGIDLGHGDPPAAEPTRETAPNTAKNGRKTQRKPQRHIEEAIPTPKSASTKVKPRTSRRKVSPRLAKNGAASSKRAAKVDRKGKPR